MVSGERSFAVDHRVLEAALTEAARAITIPALLVRGGSSEIVHEAHVRDFLKLVPHAETIDVSGARHMVAGDSNRDTAQPEWVSDSEVGQHICAILDAPEDFPKPILHLRSREQAGLPEAEG